MLKITPGQKHSQAKCDQPRINKPGKSKVLTQLKKKTLKKRSFPLLYDVIGLDS